MNTKLHDILTYIENFNLKDTKCDVCCKTLFYPNFTLRTIFNDIDESLLETCSCGNKVFKSSMMYYPRFMVSLCPNCIKRIHFRLSAEYTLKLVGELRYRNKDIVEINNYIIPLKRVLGWLHLGILDNRTAILVLREMIDTDKDITNIIIPYNKKSRSSTEIKMGVTNEQAKSLVTHKSLANFFEIIAWCNFVIQSDFYNYGDQKIIREKQALEAIVNKVNNNDCKKFYYG